MSPVIRGLHIVKETKSKPLRDDKSPVILVREPSSNLRRLARDAIELRSPMALNDEPYDEAKYKVLRLVK
jgi:hypothetical protein